MVRARAALLKEVRAFFDERGFLEVQPPCLAADCVVDAYIDPIVIEARLLGLPAIPDRERFFLQSSPESAMKRMLAEGAPSIYSIGPVFRAGEQGALHNLEFTMLEWYHVGATEQIEISLLSDLASVTLGADRCDVVRYADAFEAFLGVHPLDAPLDQLAQLVAETDSALAHSLRTDRDGLLDVLISERIQPKLGSDRPVVLKDFPASQAALAKLQDDDNRFAARFELYDRGVELANGYEELLDADELVARAGLNNRRRVQGGREPLPVETKLVQAMRQGLPPCSGVALGLDRLLMRRCGATTLEEVMPLPFDRV